MPNRLVTALGALLTIMAIAEWTFVAVELPRALGR